MIDDYNEYLERKFRLLERLYGRKDAKRVMWQYRWLWEAGVLR